MTSAKCLLHLATVVAVLFGSTPAAWSHGVADQVNDPQTLDSFNCGLGPSLDRALGQSFIPSRSLLSGVSLRLAVGSSDPVSTELIRGATTTVRIREGGDICGGTVLGESSAELPPHNYFSPFQGLVHFDFTPPLKLMIGQTYTIEWVPLCAPFSSCASWFGTEADVYATGQRFGCVCGVGGDPSNAQADYNFITHGPGGGPRGR